MPKYQYIILQTKYPCELKIADTEYIPPEIDITYNLICQLVLF